MAIQGWIAIQLLINCWVLSKKYQEFALLSALAKTRLAKILNTVETTTFFVDECHFPDASESSKLLQFQLDIPHPGVPPTINMVCSDFSTKNQKSNILFLPQAMHFFVLFPRCSTFGVSAPQTCRSSKPSAKWWLKVKPMESLHHRHPLLDVSIKRWGWE